MQPVWEDPRIVRAMTLQLATRKARIAAGEKPLGWKVGFGAPAAMEKFRISGPLVGFLMQSGEIATGGAANLASWAKPVAEPEIAAHIGRDIAPGGSLGDAVAAIAALSPAIELADAGLPFDDAEAIVRINIFQRHVILGPRDASRAGGRTAGLAGHVVRRGQVAASTSDPEALTGKIPAIIRHVADYLGAFGERLRAGDVVITGSVVPPIFVEADETAIGFDLAPIGHVAVTFAR